MTMTRREQMADLLTQIGDLADQIVEDLTVVSARYTGTGPAPETWAADPGAQVAMVANLFEVAAQASARARAAVE
jgi:hypothetical protein